MPSATSRCCRGVSWRVKRTDRIPDAAMCASPWLQERPKSRRLPHASNNSSLEAFHKTEDHMTLQETIDECWENRANFSASSAPGNVRQAVNSVLARLDAGDLRVAEPAGDGNWTVHQWIKKAVLL